MRGERYLMLCLTSAFEVANKVLGQAACAESAAFGGLQNTLQSEAAAKCNGLRRDMITRNMLKPSNDLPVFAWGY